MWYRDDWGRMGNDSKQSVYFKKLQIYRFFGIWWDYWSSECGLKGSQTDENQFKLLHISF